MTAKPKRGRPVLLLALTGFAIAGILWALEIQRARSQGLIEVDSLISVTLFLLCPPSLLSIILFDRGTDSIEGVITWLVIALANAALYAAIGWLALWVRAEARAETASTKEPEIY